MPIQGSCFPSMVTRVLLSAALVMPVTGVAAADPGVGLLVAETSAEKVGPESQAAYALAKELASATLVMPTAEGGFVDAGGAAVSLDRFRVIWHHQGDSSEQTTAACDPRVIEALRAYVAEGHGLFLSGAALAMVRPLGIETAQPRLGQGGTGEYVAGVIPEELGHPIFQGLAAQGINLPESVGGNPRDVSVPINDAGYPAFADFYGSGGPLGGMLLARASAGAENPLVEYELGKGRVVVLGWRLPRYAHAENAHRANLERLTQNILAYLGKAEQWQQVVVTPGVPAPTSEPGIPADQWRAAHMAVADLIETFDDRYPKGPEYLERLEALARSHDELLSEESELDEERRARLDEIAQQFHALRQEALLANPLLDFGRLLLVERGAARLGLPANWQSNSSLGTTGYDNPIAVLAPVRPDGELTTLYRPEGGRFVGDVDLHFDSDRMLFSMPG
ncbi:MAG: hypothetical protein ABIK89_23675, partial [Planctomycetota bacterium]